MLATNMINAMVDNMVTPEGLAGMLARGKPESQKTDSTAPRTNPDSTVKAPRIERAYEGLDVFKVTYHDPESDDPMITLVMNRAGLFSWKLTSIRMHYIDTSSNEQPQVSPAPLPRRTAAPRRSLMRTCGASRS
jgi:hypothetical protein